MRILSSAFGQGEMIPAQYARQGGNVSPPVHIEGVPLNARSLVLLMEDPDAPRGSFLHWLLFNLDPKRIEIVEGEVPDEAQLGCNDWGETGYGGPQPPSGEHRYYLRLYALDKKLRCLQGADRQLIEDSMRGHVLAKAEWVGVFAAEMGAGVR